MNWIRRSEGSGFAGGWTSGMLALLIAMSAGVSGCSDHRMSLGEFMSLQEQVPRDVPTTQPVDPEAQQAAMKLVDEQFAPYEVGESDVLLVTITGLQEPLVPQVQVRVDRNGQVDLPTVGPVHVAGLALEDVEDVIVKAYVPKVFQEAAVHVELSAPETTDVLVSGAAAMPGLVRLQRTHRNLLHAIVSAGGVSETASGEVSLCRLRKPATVTTLNLLEPEGLTSAMALEPLEDGDIVKVHAAQPNTVFVGGLVNAPRPQLYPAGVHVSVLQAIAGSGGLRVDVTPREATLIRRMSDGTDAHVKLDLDRMTCGEDPNLMLAAGDILWVPHTAETRIQEWINRNIFFRMGATVTAGASYDAFALEYMNSNAKSSDLGGSGQTLQDRFDPFGFLRGN